GDTNVETDEAFTVGLSSPNGGAVLDVMSTGMGTIRNDDVASPNGSQPDDLIRLVVPGHATKFVGNHIYNLTGDKQTAKTHVKISKSKSFLLKIQNDGDTSDSFTVKGDSATLAG